MVECLLWARISLMLIKNLEWGLMTSFPCEETVVSKTTKAMSSKGRVLMQACSGNLCSSLWKRAGHMGAKEKVSTFNSCLISVSQFLAGNSIRQVKSQGRVWGNVPENRVPQCFVWRSETGRCLSADHE